MSFSVNLRCRTYIWKLLKSCCKRVPKFTHLYPHLNNFKIPDLDSQEVKHQIQGLLWASRHLGCRIIWGVICHQHYQLSHQPYIQISTSAQIHKERVQTRLWSTSIAFLWPLERKSPVRKTLDNISPIVLQHRIYRWEKPRTTRPVTLDLQWFRADDN